LLAFVVASMLGACADSSANAPLDCEDRFLDEDIEVRSQDELDALPTVTGIRSLTIIDSDVTSLERLGCLERAGWIHIENNPDLESLRGLDALVDVDGDNANTWLDATGLVMLNNSGLRSLEGLGALQNVNGVLRVEASQWLADLSGLSTTSSIDQLALKGNGGLSSLAPLTELNTGSVRKLIIQDNDNLQSLESLRVFQSVELHIEGNDGLETLSPLVSVGPGSLLSIRGNAALVDTSSLTEVMVGSFLVENNPSIRTLAHIRAVVAVGVVLRENDVLRDVPTLLEDDSFFPSTLGCTQWCLDCAVYGNVIAGNVALETLAGFSDRSWLCGGLEIVDNDALRTLTGLEGVEKIGALEPDSGSARNGDVTIDDNAVLESVGPLDPSREGSLKLLADLEVAGNSLLPTCDAQQLVDGLMGVGWDGEAIVENNGDGTCP
jgi:hypothetical protein